jgi:hypothetical protein
MFQVLKFTGIRNGWAAIGAPRSKFEALQLLTICERVNGYNWIYRLAPIK